MTLKELLVYNSKEDDIDNIIDNIIKEYYDDYDDTINIRESYRNVINNSIYKIKPTYEYKFTINIEFDTKEEYYHVHGKDSNNISYALDHVSWSDWLGMNININDLTKIGVVSFITHVLYEMTFVSFDEKEIQKQKENISNIIKQIDKEFKHPKINTHVMIEIYYDDIDKNIIYEILKLKIFVPELILELNNRSRPIEDWYYESFNDFILNDIKNILPEKFEIYDDNNIITYECIGVLNINSFKDYNNEYDEEVIFDIVDWTVKLQE